MKKQPELDSFKEQLVQENRELKLKLKEMPKVILILSFFAPLVFDRSAVCFKSADSHWPKTLPEKKSIQGWRIKHFQ